MVYHMVNMVCVVYLVGGVLVFLHSPTFPPLFSSMYPLLVKDNLVLAAWPTLVLYLLLSVLVWWKEIVKSWKLSLFMVSSRNYGCIYSMCVHAYVGSVYMCVFMYVGECLCTFMWVSVYMCHCVFMYVGECLCTYTYVGECACTYSFICVWVSVLVHMWVCVYVYIYVWVSVCVFIYLVECPPLELMQVNASLLPLCGLCLASHLISPPSKLPDLFPVLISSFSFLHFVSFALFYHWEQLFGSS